MPTADDVDVKSTRERVVEEYTKARNSGRGHDAAILDALHEVRTCSEVEAREWVREAHDAAHVEDDPETASAPEPGQRWEFDETVTAAFDDMLSKSIPNYDDMRRFVTDATAYFVKRSVVQRPFVVDLGSSRGAALAPIVDKIGAQARYLACDVSTPMLEACRERFEGWIEAGMMEVREHDLREGAPMAKGPYAVCLSVLTLQFTPQEYRPRILGSIYDQMINGGALILVEKVMGQNVLTDELMRSVYHEHKLGQGYTQEAIDRKAMSLEGVLVPLTASFNEQLLRDAGFASAECCWAWGNFRGWIAVKR